MSKNKNKKKRNKSYSGENASIERPTITRIEAVSRSPFKQWWFENNTKVKRVVKVVLVIAAIALIIAEIIAVANGGSI